MVFLDFCLELARRGDVLLGFLTILSEVRCWNEAAEIRIGFARLCRF